MKTEHPVLFILCIHHHKTLYLDILSEWWSKRFAQNSHIIIAHETFCPTYTFASMINIVAQDTCSAGYKILLSLSLSSTLNQV